jgi:dTDP-4-dehydrorhamnose reductase
VKVVITGVRGQLGSALREAAPEGIATACYDREELDITDAEAVEHRIAAAAPRWILNAAAYTAVDRAETDRERAHAVNATGAGNLARAARRTGSRLLHVSTDFVFPGTRTRPYRPDSPTGPVNVYGETKLAGEEQVRSALEGDAVIVRTSWVYSSHGVNFVTRMLELMRTREELRIVHDQVGSPSWVVPLARCIWMLATSDARGGTRHWCDAGVASWYDFAVAIQEEALARGLLARAIPLHAIRSDEYVTAAERPAYSVLDTRSTTIETGLAPAHWRTNLRLMLDTLRPARDG